MQNPWVAVRVGNDGDAGVMEIQDMMFTAKGPTAGVILMEWNVAQDAPGSAAMWGKLSSEQHLCNMLTRRRQSLQDRWRCRQQSPSRGLSKADRFCEVILCRRLDAASYDTKFYRILGECLGLGS